MLLSSVGDMKFLQKLILYDNNLSGSIPADIAELYMLNTLNANRNELTGNLPDNIGQATALTSIQLSNNMLSGMLPESINDLENLIILDIQGNNIVDLPQYSARKLGNLLLFSIQNNKLEFDDLEKNINVTSSFLYSPQQEVNEPLIIDVTEGETTDMSVVTGGANNTYQWLKNDEEILNAQSSVYHVDNVNFTHGGIYICEVTNTAVPGLTIRRREVVLKVKVSLEANREALIKLYHATDGDNWTNNTNWLDETVPLDQWYGVTLNGNVSELHLSNNNLTGYIPAEIGQLNEMVHLDLSGNNISGEIPTEIVYILDLEELHLNDNLLSGSIPSELISLKTVSIIKLNNNYLEGSIPQFNSSSLQIINLSNNILVDMPALNSSELSDLQVLLVAQNKLTFEDLESNTDVDYEFIYSPQADVNIFTENQILNVILSVDVAGQNNKYQWYHDDKDIPEAIQNSISLNATDLDNEGRYYCVVTNNDVTGLDILSFAKDLKVNVVVEKPTVEIPEAYCIGQDLVTLSADLPDNDDIIIKWYGDPALTDFLYDGYQIRHTINGDRDTLYVVQTAGSSISQSFVIPLILRPTITQEGNSLVASYLEGAEYEWFYNNEVIENEKSNKLTITSDGEYYVKLRGEICVATSQIRYVNGGVLGLDNHLAGNPVLSVYPNPASNIINVKLTGETPNQVQLAIYSLSGELILSKEYSDTDIQTGIVIDSKPLSVGMYILNLKTDKLVMRKKISVVR